MRLNVYNDIKRKKPCGTCPSLYDLQISKALLGRYQNNRRESFGPSNQEQRESRSCKRLTDIDMEDKSIVYQRCKIHKL